MSINRSCFICLEEESNTFPLRQKVSGKCLPHFVQNVCKTQIRSPNLANVAICPDCAISMVHVEALLEKLRRAVGRLEQCENKKTAANSSVVKSSFACDKCPFGSDAFNTLKSHLKEQHNVERPRVRCKYCRKSYLMLDKFNAHLESVHKIKPRPTKDRNYVCQKCGKKLFRRGHAHVCINPEQPTLSSEEVDHSFEACTQPTPDFESNNGEPIASSKKRKSSISFNCDISFESRQEQEAGILSEKHTKSMRSCPFPNCERRFTSSRKVESHIVKRHKDLLDSTDESA